MFLQAVKFRQLCLLMLLQECVTVFYLIQYALKMKAFTAVCLNIPTTHALKTGMIKKFRLFCYQVIIKILLNGDFRKVLNWHVNAVRIYWKSMNTPLKTNNTSDNDKYVLYTSCIFFCCIAHNYMLKFIDYDNQFQLFQLWYWTMKTYFSPFHLI